MERLDYRFTEIFIPQKKKLAVEHSVLGAIAVSHHAWVRFCQRYLNKKGNRKKLFNSETYFESQLRQTFARSVQIFPLPEQQLALARQYAGGDLHEGRYWVDQRTNMLFVIHARDSVMLTTYYICKPKEEMYKPQQTPISLAS